MMMCWLCIGANNRMYVCFVQQESAARVGDIEEDIDIQLVPQLARDIQLLWQDEGIKETVAQAAKFQLIDSAQ